MLDQETSKDLRSATFSLESEVGHLHSDSPDGQTPKKYGAAVAHANHSASRENEKDQMMKDTYGQPSTNSSPQLDLMSCLESKSPPPMLSDQTSTRTCSRCGAQKPSSDFRNGSKGRKYHRCKSCVKELAEQSPKTKPRLAKANKKWRAKNRGWQLLSSAKDRAKDKGLPFEITFHEIQAKVDAGICEATGIPFNLSEPRAWNSPSLDQIEPGKGYTHDNTRVVIYAYNVMANVWGEKRILEVAQAISARRRKNSNDLSARLAEKLKQRLDLNGSLEYELTWKEVVTPSGHQYSLVLGGRRRRARTRSGERTASSTR
jgi:hypothetical protein